MSSCGTVRGYFRHRRADESTCEACRLAMAEYQAARRATGLDLVEHVCAQCGAKRQNRSRKTTTLCRSCANRLNGALSLATRQAVAAPRSPCKGCGGETLAGRKYCSDECYAPVAEMRALAQRGALRIAIDAGDHAGILAAIHSKCEVDPTTKCWVGFGRLKDGYPTVNVAGRSYLGHRLSLEAKLGKPLGKQAAHHMCANSACVNPDHLQPVTARENVAEMLARTYMESRIADLESALAAHAPDHPLLAELGVVAA